MRCVVLECPAKLNLFLEVLGRRPDGFHELATVMVPIDLTDMLEVRPARRFRLEVEGATLDGLNTVERAYREARRRSRIPPVQVRLVKRIPAGSGLGGGSSDAAAMLVALDRLFGAGLDLAGTGARVGSDVNFFLQRGAALCTGRGEAVASLARAPVLHAVVVRPGFSLATPDVYGRVGALLSRRTRDVARFLISLGGGRPDRVGPALFNRLEPAAVSLRPELGALGRRLRRLPLAGTCLTGSGSAYFALCASRAEAERWARRLRRDLPVETWAVSTLCGGAPPRPIGLL